MRRDELYLLKYREAIREGRIVAGQELIMELDRLIDDLDDSRYIYDTADAYERIDFMQGCIRLTKSPFYNQPMVLELWQKALIEAAYSFKMADTGFLRFKRVLLVISRKNTKSETCSALGLTEAILGPEGSDIVCSSNDDNQASILYDAIDTMRLLIDPEQLDTWRNQRFIRINDKNSKIFKLSDRTRNKEGRNIDKAYVDEVHEMKENTIIKAIEQSQSTKDNPQMWIITTEGFVNDGVLDNLLVEARKIINGEDDSISAERFLPWLYTQDSEQEVWEDPRSWQKSNPMIDVVKKRDYLAEQVDKARKSKADRMFVLAKDFNLKQSNSQAWMNEEDYTYPATFDPELFRGSICLGGVDLAETTDLTSAKALVMRKGDPTKYVLQHYWIPELKLENSDDRTYGARYSEWAQDGHLTICEGNDVDLTLVADWYFGLYENYDIALYKCGYDVKFSRDFLRRMDDYGFDCELVAQNKITLSNATKLAEADFKARRINYRENPIDRWCFGNASLEIDNLGNVMAVKINNQPGRRIDGAVSLVILWEIYRRWRSDFAGNALAIDFGENEDGGANGDL